MRAKGEGMGETDAKRQQPSDLNQLAKRKRAAQLVCYLLLQVLDVRKHVPPS